MARDWRPEAAEAVGTFFLLLVGGAAILTRQPGWLVAATFGATILVLVHALGHLSGAHFNPAITLAFAATRHFPAQRILSYLLAQTLGALAATFVLVAWRPVDAVVASGPMVGASGLLVEALATFLLAFVIIAVATDERSPPGVAGLAIGATVALGSLVAGPLTGAAMNPARALAPALVAGQWGGLAIHLAGPIVGAVAGMMTYEALRRGARPRNEAALGVAGPIELEETA